MSYKGEMGLPGFRYPSSRRNWAGLSLNFLPFPRAKMDGIGNGQDVSVYISTL